MSSFDVAVSALSNQRERLELLGTNIANINTPGYKASRMTFVETLGAIVNVTRSPFTQGSLEFTGNATDLAINGNGFFIVKKGEDQVYTRSGAFFIDADGKLGNADGYVVQGWVNNSISGARDNSSASQLQDIVIDPNLIMPAKTTENVYLSGNLNAGLTPEAEVWKTSGTFTTKAILTGNSAITFPLDVTATNNQFQIQYDPPTGDGSPVELTLTNQTYNDIDAFVTEINAQIATSPVLTENVEAYNDGNTLKFRAIDGESGTEITLRLGTNDMLVSLGFTDGQVATSGNLANETTPINDLLQINGDFVDGDTLNVSGSNNAGTSLARTYTYGTAEDGITLGSLVTVINALFAGSSTAVLDEGKIVLTDDIPGESESQIALAVGSSSVGEKISLPSFANSTPGFTGRVTMSMVVYDSLGASHNLTTEFTKTENDGEWTWDVAASDNETMVSGASGKVIFDANGNFISLQYDGGVDALTFSPGDGAATQTIKIMGRGAKGFSGMSQYDFSSTLHAREQDGRKTGSLNGFQIDVDGAIFGSFTNGEKMELGHIALAKFNNPSGLNKVSGSNFIDTIDSGIAQIGSPNSLDSDIESGSLESSTVDLTEELTSMIEAQRSFQAAARVLSTYTDFLEETVRLG
ncbi:MAG: flagellar hook-basal body complex protein [Simkaniaceae bacterium]|nr:flagellar hook-basal body complex protein [Simkaniaceae bacterium]